MKVLSALPHRTNRPTAKILSVFSKTRVFFIIIKLWMVVAVSWAPTAAGEESYLHPSATSAHYACLNAYIPYPKYSWSSNELSCADISASQGGTQFPYKLFSVVQARSLSDGSHIEIAWHTNCTNLMTWGSPNHTFESCKEYRYYFITDLKCPDGYFFNQAAKCVAQCPSTYTWNDSLKLCEPPPDVSDCRSQSSHPIDFSQGQKYRTEHIATAGRRFQFSLEMYYNNQRNVERTITSAVGFPQNSSPVASIIEPIHIGRYITDYNENGLLSGRYPAQNFDGINRYWRHSYNEILLPRGGQTVYETAQGQRIIFSSFGVHPQYSHLRLSAVTPAEGNYIGKIENSITGETKYFFYGGYLGKILRPSGDVLQLFYDMQIYPSLLVRITNSENASLDLAYLFLGANSIYSRLYDMRGYLNNVTTNTGESTALRWDHSFSGATEKFLMLTRIQSPLANGVSTAREFDYSDTRWPMSLTDIYDVPNAAQPVRKLYAHFGYDSQGRAIYSGLAGGVDAVKVDYVSELSRVITNALGKKSTYEFADFNGVRRLKTVTGEPTATCVKSATSFDYDTAGNIKNENKNGLISHREYDSQNREILRTDAFGTPDATTVQTCWNTSVNQPSRVITATAITQFVYFSNGKLRSQTTSPRPAGLIACDTPL